jgi:uncharacterized membrane protein (DUF4010 family)
MGDGERTGDVRRGTCCLGPAACSLRDRCVRRQGELAGAGIVFKIVPFQPRLPSSPMPLALDSQQFYHGVLLSLALGGAVGLVRQWADQHESPQAEPSAGLRTFALWALLGFVLATIGGAPASAPFVAGLVLFVLSAVAMAWRPADAKEHPLGATSLAAGVLTFLAGALAAWDELRPAMAVAAGTMVLLAAKPFVHRWTERLTSEDVYLFLQFVVISVLILPVLPDRGFGPLEAFNPYKTWLMVVLISGLGFVGYVMVRWVGAKRGLLLTGVAGGLASSTATTLAFSRASKVTPELAAPLAMGILLASTIMLGRVWVIILALDRVLAMALILPLAVMAIPTAVFLGWVFWRGKANEASVETFAVSNPLSLRVAVKFALLYALIVLLVKLSQAHGSEGSFFPIAFLSGLTDMDAIALSVTNEHSAGGLLTNLAARGILVGAIANTLFKLGFALALGHRALRLSLSVGMLPMALAGAAGLALVGFWP